MHRLDLIATAGDLSSEALRNSAPRQQAHVIKAMLANKASLGLADMADEQVMRQAAAIQSALLAVCVGIDADVKAGEPSLAALAFAALTGRVLLDRRRRKRTGASGWKLRRQRPCG